MLARRGRHTGLCAMRFCSECGSRLVERRREHDRAPRFACVTCHAVYYLNPRLVVACIAAREDRILLCRRGNSPGYGQWNLPSGFVERGEPAAVGAAREALEEAQATVELERPYALFHLPHENQMQIVYLARLQGESFGAGTETLEVRLFKEADIPWGQLAFVSTQVALRQYFGDVQSGRFGFHFADILQIGHWHRRI